MASVHRIILSSGQWVKVPQDANVNYFCALKESELATAFVVSLKKRKTVHCFTNRQLRYLGSICSQPLCRQNVSHSPALGRLKEGQ